MLRPTLLVSQEALALRRIPFRFFAPRLLTVPAFRVNHFFTVIGVSLGARFGAALLAFRPFRAQPFNPFRFACQAFRFRAVRPFLSKGATPRRRFRAFSGASVTRWGSNLRKNKRVVSRTRWQRGFVGLAFDAAPLWAHPRAVKRAAQASQTMMAIL